jgi:hypothetical protein
MEQRVEGIHTNGEFSMKAQVVSFSYLILLYFVKGVQNENPMV